MKKSGILNSHISRIVASMGHGDMLVICDSGFPVPRDVCKIDMALTKGVPTILQTAQELSKELCVEYISHAIEAHEHCDTLIQQVKNMFPRTSIKELNHEQLKLLSKQATAIIRTGEFTPYANFIFHAGVHFD